MYIYSKILGGPTIFFFLGGGECKFMQKFHTKQLTGLLEFIKLYFNKTHLRFSTIYQNYTLALNFFLDNKKFTTLRYMFHFLSFSRIISNIIETYF